MLQHLDALVSSEATKPKATDQPGLMEGADEEQSASADNDPPALSDGVSAASSSAQQE